MQIENEFQHYTLEQHPDITLIQSILLDPDTTYTFRSIH
jgi:hypothetical protein